MKTMSTWSSLNLHQHHRSTPHKFYRSRVTARRARHAPLKARAPPNLSLSCGMILPLSPMTTETLLLRPAQSTSLSASAAWNGSNST